MGQTIKGIIKVVDNEGRTVKNAQVTLSISNPQQKVIANVPATFGSGDVYRTDAWTIPHRQQKGSWTAMAKAVAGAYQGTASITFTVDYSTSEKLLYKYGFWIGAPTLRGISPSLVKEQGDAQNGMILWGGVLPAQHVFPENWVEIQWRSGNLNLNTAAEVRTFMLDTLGDLGFTPVRDLGPFKKTRFKNWNAWQVKARGQFARYDEQWMIFYAPEVDKTYAIGTTVVLPLTNGDAHAILRKSFEIHPEIQTRGAAPEPLAQLLPSPELTGPEIGAHFIGTVQPITLTWKPVKDLAEGEYYRIRVDYNYEEANPYIDFFTRQTQFTLPETLYLQPNCSVFNWQVTLMHQTGVNQDGQPEGRPISFNSLYWYIRWTYPADKVVPFQPLCPNAQY